LEEEEEEEEEEDDFQPLFSNISSPSLHNINLYIYIFKQKK